MNSKNYLIMSAFLLALLTNLIAQYFMLDYQPDDQSFIIVVLLLVIGIMYTFHKSKSRPRMLI